MCCRSEWQERMYIYKWHEVDQTKHEIFCVHIVCNEIQVKVNLEITTFFFYLRFPYCPNFFWFGVVVYKQLGKKFEQWRLENAYTAYLLKNSIRLTFVSSSRQYTCQKYLVKSSFPIGCPLIRIRSLTCTKWGELKRECKKNKNNKRYTIKITQSM